MSMNKYKRRVGGSSVVELPVVIFLFILVLLLPLTELATLSMRATTIWCAVRMAAHSAACAGTFQENGKNGELSAVNIARRDALNVKNQLHGGVQFGATDVSVRILGQPLKAGLVAVKSAVPLTSVQPKDFLYQIEVTIKGSIDPVVSLDSDFFGEIPGLTTPLPLSLAYRAFCEHPNGLAK